MCISILGRMRLTNLIIENKLIFSFFLNQISWVNAHTFCHLLTHSTAFYEKNSLGSILLILLTKKFISSQKTKTKIKKKRTNASSLP